MSRLYTLDVDVV